MQNKEFTSFNFSFSGTRGMEEKIGIVEKVAGETVPSKKKAVYLRAKSIANDRLSFSDSKVQAFGKMMKGSGIKLGIFRAVRRRRPIRSQILITKDHPGVSSDVLQGGLLCGASFPKEGQVRTWLKMGKAPSFPSSWSSGEECHHHGLILLVSY